MRNVGKVFLALALCALVVAPVWATGEGKPACRVKIDKSINCDPIIQTDFGFESSDEQQIEVCETPCFGLIRFKYRVDNGGNNDLFNCQLEDNNTGVLPDPIWVGDVPVGGGLFRYIAEGICDDELDDPEPNTAKVTCECIDDMGETVMVMATDSAQFKCEGCTSEIACRVTGGGVDTDNNWDGSMAEGEKRRDQGADRYTFGGQAGASLASQPQPWGEWTHHQQRGPSGSFVFHAGTASAPEGTEIDLIVCSDPDNCVPARTAPAKQIDFRGVGTFKNMKNTPSRFNVVTVGESLHWFHVHIEDLGEPGKGGKVNPPAGHCPPEGHANEPDGDEKCKCPDYYSITIHETADPGSDILYEVDGYIKGGNLQIHPPTGRDQ